MNSAQRQSQSKKPLLVCIRRNWEKKREKFSVFPPFPIPNAARRVRTLPPLPIPTQVLLHGPTGPPKWHVVAAAAVRRERGPYDAAAGAVAVPYTATLFIEFRPRRVGSE